MQYFYPFYIIAVAILVSKVFLTRGKPTKTIAWLMVIIFIPFLGMLLYLMLGINRRREKFFKIKRTKQLDHYRQRVDTFFGNIVDEVESNFVELRPHVKLVKLMLKSTQFLPYKGNRVQILRDGPATFESIFIALEKATSFIHLQYYIYEDGALADRLAKVFAQKISEGVEVRLIYDGIGSRKLSRNYLRRLMKMGVQVHGFLPIRLKQFVTSFNYRNHRKILIVDGEIAYTGGINISDKYLIGDPYLGVWHDMHVSFEGPIVRSFQAVFSMDWYFASQKEELLQSRYFPKQNRKGNSTVQIVVSGPDSDFSSIRQQYFTIINQARHYIYITNSYVIPGAVILEALKNAAQSGVDVRILVPSNSDSTIVKWSIRSYFEELLLSGVRIFLFGDGFLHSKVIISDDSIASVGTANLDIRSFEQNFEINGIVYDAEIAQELKTYFQSDCVHSVELELKSFQSRPLREKLKEGMARIFSPIL